MAVIEWKKDDTVAVVTMINGENRHNPVFIDTFLKVFGELEQDASITSVVLTSNDAKNWSQGIDLTWIMAAYGEKRFQEIKDFMYGLNKMFKCMMLLPMPVIAAINGHSFGDGAIMACCCDFRFMRADRGYFCFPEIDINIPFMPGMLAIVKKAFPYYKLEEAAFSGKRYGGAELEAHHVVVKACADQDALLQESIAFGKTFKKNRPIYGEMKKRFHKEIIHIIDTEDPVFIEPLQLMM